MRGSSLVSTFLLLTSLAAAKPQDAAHRAGCQVEATNYKGWQAQQISNAWVKLIIVPQNGGRLMQVVFNGHEYLFVNPQYAGKYLPPDETKWFNYGGDKLWPLPEGNEDEQHWAGGSDVLDDGAYTFQVTSEAPQCSISLTGPPDPRTGLQFMRTISLQPDSPQIHFHALMKNATGHPIEWSVQSVSQYNTADPQDASNYNRDLRAYTPANPRSSYLERYHVRFGPAENPFVRIQDDGLFALDYGYLAAELWIDSTAGWLAVVNGASAYAMVERFHYQENARYPGKASVIFWTNGPELHMDDRGFPSIPPPKIDETPFYMEAELNSPLVRLDPGETYPFDTDWFPTRCGKQFTGVSDAGLVSEALVASRISGAKIKLSGSFGVFFPGKLIANVYNRGGRLLQKTALQEVDPGEFVTVEKEIESGGEADRVSLHLEDSAGADRGSLGEASVEPLRGDH
ncbi:MAG TPA: hypothetical protein VMT20_04210 [Terriglobia bacterium]|nr:hypothetical protein [Terriglobia bacterium]